MRCRRHSRIRHHQDICTFLLPSIVFFSLVQLILPSRIRTTNNGSSACCICLFVGVHTILLQDRFFKAYDTDSIVHI